LKKDYDNIDDEYKKLKEKIDLVILVKWYY
jgi:hypothetical protein